MTTNDTNDTNAERRLQQAIQFVVAARKLLQEIVEGADTYTKVDLGHADHLLNRAEQYINRVTR